MSRLEVCMVSVVRTVDRMAKQSGVGNMYSVVSAID